jgi:hypothetical protein
MMVQASDTKGEYLKECDVSMPTYLAPELLQKKPYNAAGTEIPNTQN